MNARQRNAWITLAALLGGILAIIGFYDVGRQYGEFRQRYGVGTYNIPAEELVFYLWYLFLGLMAMGCLAFALFKTSLVSRLAHGLEKLVDKRWLIPAATCFLFIQILWFRHFILKYGPITDDEETYRFIAQTLMKGRLANPSPGDEAFFTNQFIVHQNGLWYGKYPIGHPLFLAAGALLNLRYLVVPLITCGTFVVTYFVGREILPKRQASLGALLLLCSMQFVFMGATDLSQPTTSLFMMLGFYGYLRYQRRPTVLFALLSGIMWGYGILVRPFPSVLFLPVITIGFLFFSEHATMRQRLKGLAIGIVPIVVAALCLFAVNAAQTGDPYASGYHTAHQKTAIVGSNGLGVLRVGPGIIGSSVAGALLRQNFWLFGWPLSLIFVLFAKPKRHVFVFFGLIAAVYAYRFLVPKTVVNTLGPVYVTEMIPLLCLATASGITKTTNWLLEKHGSGMKTVPASIALSSMVVALACFLPIQLRDISRGAHLRATVLASIEKAIPTEAIVFTRFLIDPRLDSTWAPHPPNPSPDLTDRIIFVRSQPGEAGQKRQMDFWQRRFPRRSAWKFELTDTGPSLTPMVYDRRVY